MKGELTAIIEKAPEANGQGETTEETKESFREAVTLIFEDRMEVIKRGLHDDGAA